MYRLVDGGQRLSLWNQRKWVRKRNEETRRILQSKENFMMQLIKNKEKRLFHVMVMYFLNLLWLYRQRLEYVDWTSCSWLNPHPAKRIPFPTGCLDACRHGKKKKKNRFCLVWNQV